MRPGKLCDASDLCRASLVAAALFCLSACASSSLPPASPQPLEMPQLAEGDALLVGSGDIAKCGSQLEYARATAALVKQFPDATVFTAGDNAYESGTAEQFANCYDATWGAFKERTHPTPGNHDHRSKGAQPYLDYFGVKPFYSFEVKSWHVVALDSMLDMTADSPQAKWLDSDLAATKQRCIAAIWHHPRYSSGPHGLQPNDPGRKTAALWSILAAHHATLIVNGHDHHYERFAPRDGLRQFIIGTGGAELYPSVGNAEGSEARDDQHFGILVLTLHPSSYEWRFLGIDGLARDVSAEPVSCSR